jgi:hypothetical protein
MALISQQVLHLLSGVSQRPALHRADSQVESQVNALSSAARGLMKRPPVEYQHQLTTTLTGWDTAFVHPVERDDNERHRIVIVNGAIKVYDVETGSELTVRTPDGEAYLATPGTKGYRARTVGDNTYGVNRNKTVLKNTAFKSSKKVNQALVYVRQADYSTPYFVELNGKAYAYTTPDPSTAATEGSITTEKIAERLKEEMQKDPAIALLFSIQQFKSSLLIKRLFDPFGVFPDFTIGAYDGLGGTALKAVKNEIQNIEDLPRWAKRGMVLKVTGDPGTVEDDFYVEYFTDSTPEDGGVWKETIGPNMLKAFDRSTMPHVLERKGSWFEPTEHEAPPVEPLLSYEATDSVVEDDGWEEEDDGTVVDPNDDKIVRDHEKGWDHDPVVNNEEVTIRVAYDIDTTLVDPGEGARVVLYKKASGTGTLTKLGEQIYDPGHTLIEEDIKVTTSSLATGDKIALRLEYDRDSTPATDAQKAVLTVKKKPVDEEDFGLRRRKKKPPIEKEQVRTGVLTYDTTAVFPVGTQARVTIDNNDTFQYTTADGEGAAEIAAGLQALIDANINYASTNPSSGVCRVQYASPTTFPDIETSTILPQTVFYNSGLSFVTNEFAGKTLVNRSDGSSGTVLSNTADTIVIDGSGLTGGKDNVIVPGDICLVEEAGTYFVFKQVPWALRGKGDDNTNPFPNFVDQEIDDVFFYENRLGFLSGSNIVMSRTGDVYDLWRSTTITVRDDDRISVEAAHSEVSMFHSAVLWNKVLYAWAENVQMQITGEPAMSPRTIRTDVASRYFNSTKFRPLNNGARLLFSHSREGYAKIMEYPPPSEDTPDVFEAKDLTMEIPSYLSGKVVDMAADAALGLTAVVVDGQQSSIFIYNWQVDEQNTPIQEAWSRWDFPSTTKVLSVDFVAGKLGVILKRSDAIYLGEVNLEIPVAPTAAEQAKNLDLLVTDSTPGVTVVYSGGHTTWTLPYEVNVDQSTDGELSVYRTDTYVKQTVVRPAANQIRVENANLSAVAVRIGVLYTTSIQLSKLYRRNDDGSADKTGRLQCRYIDFHYHDTTDFRVKVTPAGRSTYTYPLAQQSPDDGDLRVPVMTRADTATIVIEQVTAGGMRLSGFDWEGFYHRRNRRA